MNFSDPQIKYEEEDKNNLIRFCTTMNLTSQALVISEV